MRNSRVPFRIEADFVTQHIGSSAGVVGSPCGGAGRWRATDGGPQPSMPLNDAKDDAADD